MKQKQLFIALAPFRGMNNFKRSLTIIVLFTVLCPAIVFGQYTDLLNFTGTANGNNPQGDLFYDGTYLYGTTVLGGANNYGVVFKVKPDGSGYVDLLDFSDTANGKLPHGSLISDGTFLYGMTQYGGVNNEGVVFKIKPDGTGFSKMLDCNGVATGIHPFGRLIAVG